MKKTNNHLMSISLVLISVLSISFGATAIRYANTKSAAADSHLVGLKKYNGEWISVIQLPEVTITESLVKKSK